MGSIVILSIHERARSTTGVRHGVDNDGMLTDVHCLGAWRHGREQLEFRRPPAGRLSLH
jgi:hypothetical protein